MFIVKKNGVPYSKMVFVADAILFIEYKFAQFDDSDDATLTVEDEAAEREIIASISTNRIIGTYIKQQWGGRKNDNALTVEEVEFDGTDHILLMSLEEIHELWDSSEESDAIGMQHVSWNGPCEVTITQSICAYFGVTDVKEIHAENFAYVRNRVNPQKAQEIDITLMVKMKVRVVSGAIAPIAQSFTDTLQCTFAQTTPGVTIKSTVVSQI